MMPRGRDERLVTSFAAEDDVIAKDDEDDALD
jgi:hypothetical protein